MKEKYTFKLVTYDVDHSKRFYEDYPGIEPASMFFMWNNPWSNIQSVIRKMIIVHNLYRFIAISKPIRILDCGAGFAENRIYIDRYRKPGGMRIDYTALDSDPDKRNIALLINPNINYVISKIEEFESEDKFDAIICNDLFKFAPKGKEDEIIDHIFKLGSEKAIITISITTKYMREKGLKPDIDYNERTEEELIKSLTRHSFKILDSFYFGLHAEDILDITDRVPSNIGTYVFSLLKEYDRGKRFQIYLQKD